MRLNDLVAAGRTALLSVEMQRGVVGDRSKVPMLREQVLADGTIPRLAGLMAAARGAGVPVVHCTAEIRPDFRGSKRNCPMLGAMLKDPSHILVGSEGVQVIPELAPQPADLVMGRLHGISPFTGTQLDAALRNMGVTTVLATGVSLNVALLGLAVEAVNLGYQVVLVRDCATGFPADYAQALLRNSFAALATIATADEVMAAWG
jgi:nicotinamidase-related amidase